MTNSETNAAEVTLTVEELQRLRQFVHNVLFIAGAGSALEKECEELIAILHRAPSSA